jgi:5S rRNA maturation endonuclease (ribonuclease M5)
VYEGLSPKSNYKRSGQAIKNAISIVFPESQHRYCSLHIMRKLPKKFGAHANFNSIKRALRTCLYASQTSEEFAKN